MTDKGIASIVRSLAEGVDPGRVLRDVVHEARSRTATSHVLLAAMLEGQLVPIVAIGPSEAVLLEAARTALDRGEPARRSDPGAGLVAAAVPVRRRGTVVAVLAVAGPSAAGAGIDLDRLTAPADCAALALAARPALSLLGATAPAPGGPDFAAALAAVAAATSVNDVLTAVLELAAGRFAARAGFVCLPAGPAGVEIAAWRNVDRDRLGTASRHPGFIRLVSAPEVTVVAPGDPVVAQLTAGAEYAVCLPLASGEPGALVLLVSEEPDAVARRALAVLAAQVAAGLRSVAADRVAAAAGAQLSTVVHALAEPTLAVDAAGRFSALNAAAAELFALSDSFELGRPARGRLGHPTLEALLLDGRPAGGASGVEVVLGRPTPRRFVASARSLGAGGRVLFLRSVSAAARAGRETDALAAALGRALRDPLATITTLASAGPAGAGMAGGTDWDVARKGILAEAARLEAVADQLALLGPDDAGPAGVRVRPEPCDVVAVALRALDARRESAPGRDLGVTGPGRLDVVADRRLLERVLDPLVDNALRYSDGPITVEVSDRGDAFEVAVVDAGPGIFSGDIPGLFERYHPLDGSPERAGAGIGLYTCRRLVELMGGRIWCDSRLGVGSRFAVRLPQFPSLR